MGIETTGWLVPAIGVAVIVFAGLVNVSGNRSVGLLSILMACLKVFGIALFGVAALWAGGFSFEATGGETGAGGFLASAALAILAFKGFTTITNSGAEITEPHRNVGRAIVVSIAICVVVYLLMAFAVGSSLPLDRIIAAKDYALAEAAAPAFGQVGFYLTVPGAIRDHTLVYTVVIASLLTVFFNLSRIASLGAFFYLVMDMVIHWDVYRNLRHDIGAPSWILLTAITLDAVVLAAFALMKWQADPAIVGIALAGIAVVFAFETVFLRLRPPTTGHRHHSG